MRRRLLDRLTWLAPLPPIVLAIVAAAFSACSSPASAAAPRMSPCHCEDIAIAGKP